MKMSQEDDVTSYKLDVERLTGQSDARVNCAVFRSRVSFEDGTIATLVSCILAEGKQEEGEKNLIKDVFDLVVKKLESASGGSLDVLKVAGEASSEFVKGVSQDVSFCHALFYKNAAYIFKHGDRVKVWVYDPPKSTELNFNWGSGLQKGGQLYLIATEKFFNYFDLSSQLSEQEIDTRELVDELATEISAKEDQSEIGAALVYIKENKLKAKDGVGSEVNGEKEIKKKMESETSKEASEESYEVDSEVLRPVVNKHESSVQVEPGITHETIDQGSKSRFKNPLGVLAAIPAEIKRLKRGDIKAIFRLRRKIVVVAIIILMILAISAFFTIRGASDRKKLDEFNSHLGSASSKYEEAVAILNLNKSRAREILISADGEVAKALELIPKDEKASELSTKISEKLKETENLSNVNLSTLVEVSGDLVSIAKSGKSLVGFSNNQIFDIDVENKSSDVVEGRQTTVSGYVYDNFAFVYLGSDVYKIALANGNSEKAFEGEGAYDIAVFLGNVYLLSDKQIFKHTPIEGGYGGGVDYFNESQQLESSSRFAIDGSVWVTTGGSILNYLRGEKQDFAISGLVGGELKFGPIFTDAQTDSLYVIDVANSALLKIDKDGIYTTSYQSPEFKNAVDLVVDEAGGKMYVAVGNKVLEADL
ncbi:hypothetical protein A3A49_02045 [Candidatus Curtissbacteria bacterium RIFCSPLOWO2_01_FULL_38_11b]|uniref:PPM-type phosphatase domain-containing protein n=1 Tax=Candidatus Curtissbacteria bacterium RIFCSPLOWO2_01_FULL_38_11b TaxID=1797725 RepID=A0A1F5H1Q2_9BACT|nr:MAG: hypothetical protein A3A49_02045 [Candidatus Curtissbacteria bacterium RIFCSPLOWO2_01_FULL_38_11b]